MNRKTSNSKYDWLYFTWSYLDLARLGCKALLEEVHSGGKKLEYTSELIVAVLYNVKHGIECYLKTLSNIIDGSYTQTHDLSKLFQELRRKVQAIQFRPIQRKLGKRFLPPLTQGDIDLMCRALDSLGELITEFETLPWLTMKLENNSGVRDSKNDFFRYPESSAAALIRWDQLWGQFDEDDIRKIDEKIQQIHDLFSSVGWPIDVTISHLKKQS